MLNIQCKPTYLVPISTTVLARWVSRCVLNKNVMAVHICTREVILRNGGDPSLADLEDSLMWVGRATKDSPETDESGETLIGSFVRSIIVHLTKLTDIGIAKLQRE